MSDAGGFFAIVRVALGIALALAVPIAVATGAARLLRRLMSPDYFEVPLVTALAKLLGIAAGILLIYARFDRRYFDLHQLFVPESPWNLTLWQFLGERVNPLNYGIGTLIDYPTARGADGSFFMLLVAVIVLALATVAAPFLFWPAAMARRAALYSIVLAGLTAYLTIYVVCLLLWSLHLLNFWTFALVGMMFQYYRMRAKRA
jgi:hypothetical protein